MEPERFHSAQLTNFAQHQQARIRTNLSSVFLSRHSVSRQSPNWVTLCRKTGDWSIRVMQKTVWLRWALNKLSIYPVHLLRWDVTQCPDLVTRTFPFGPLFKMYPLPAESGTILVCFTQPCPCRSTELRLSQLENTEPDNS